MQTAALVLLVTGQVRYVTHEITSSALYLLAPEQFCPAELQHDEMQRGALCQLAGKLILAVAVQLLHGFIVFSLYLTLRCILLGILQFDDVTVLHIVEALLVRKKKKITISLVHLHLGAQ